MKSWIIGLSLGLLSVFAAHGQQADAAAQSSQLGIQEVFSGFLRGSHQVPGLATDATGSWRAVFKPDFRNVRVWIGLNEAVGITQAHFHCGPPGTNGPVVAFLFGFDSDGVDVDGDFLVRGGTLTNAKIIPQDPPSAPCEVTINNIESLYFAAKKGQIYVNVHSQANPPGEVRGQVFSHHQIEEY